MHVSVTWTSHYLTLHYQDQLVELERIVLELKALGPVIVMGDFNAHLCPPVGVNSCNTGQNVLLDELMRRCELYAVSLHSQVKTRLVQSNKR